MHVARIAAGHVAAIEMTTSVLGNLVTNGNALNAYLYLRGVGDEPLHGREARAACPRAAGRRRRGVDRSAWHPRDSREQTANRYS